jgi:uncharacterized protein (DUF2237 family)
MNLQEHIRKVLREEIIEDKNLYGNKLKPCSKKPMTGFYRDGYCRTGDDDTGSHTVCAEVTEEFLKFTNSKGNNLDMLEPGDKWCLCALRWKEANEEGVAPKIIKSSTNIKTLDIIKKVEQELDEYARTLKNARKHGTNLRFPKSAIKANPQRFRKYTKDIIRELDPKEGTGKKPEGSGRRLYTDENPNDTVSVKFRTKEDIVNTLNKESFKSKSHKRQSQIINLIHQRVRAAYQNAKNPETKQRLKRAYDYIEDKKEQSKQKTIRLQKQEQKEGELTEKCWPGYTQKGMKTMFGKRYPNCVKIKKKKTIRETIKNILIQEVNKKYLKEDSFKYLEYEKNYEQIPDEIKNMNIDDLLESKQERKFTKLLTNIEEFLNSNEYPSVVRLMVNYDEVMDDVIVNIFFDPEHAVKLGGGINYVIKKTGEIIMEDLSVFPFDFKYHIHFEKPKLNES